jgi:hypothetical protein
MPIVNLIWEVNATKENGRNIDVSGLQGHSQRPDPLAVKKEDNSSTWHYALLTPRKQKRRTPGAPFFFSACIFLAAQDVSFETEPPASISAIIRLAVQSRSCFPQR